MRRSIIAAAATGMLLALTGTAAAQDENADKWNHGGLYIGATGGYSIASMQSDGLDIAGKGAFGGAFLGFGQVIGGVYVGAEMDFLIKNIKPSVTDGTTTLALSNDWTATARLRAGIPVGPALFYGTAGVAVEQSKLSVTGLGNDQQYVVGAVGGVGLEAQITRTLAIRIEALHYAMPAETFTIQGVSGSLKQDENIARVGFSLKLN